MSDSAAPTVTMVVLRIIMILNWLVGAAIVALLVATIVATEWSTRALGIAPGSELRAVLPGLQVIAALGLAAVPLYHAILKRLLAIVATVRDGNPFIPANAERLYAMAWVQVALQLLSLAVAAVGKMVETKTFPLHLDAGFSVSGWLAILLTFVLAQLFAEGARMRDDLEGTV
jgi:hypothetical protein